MDFEAFHFAQPEWLWGLILVPVIWVLFFFFSRPKNASKRLEAMIDPHLLPFLLMKGNAESPSRWKYRLLSWSVIWSCLILALAGPRWSFREIETLSKDQSLVVLLDLSKSMEAADVKPSRLVRARQKIEDLLQLSQGIKIGLVAFAADPHMITPLTEDKETLRHLLPFLGTDLVYVQGSRLSPALKMAAAMLAAEPSQHQAVVVISDGGFEDSGAISDVKQLVEQGVDVHAIGIGTLEGALLQERGGGLSKHKDKAVHSKLGRELLQELAKMGRGYYIESRYSSYDESVIVDRLQNHSDTISEGKTMRIWEEGFFYCLLPALPFLLFWFRKGTLMMVVGGLLTFSTPSLEASLIETVFMNSEEVGAAAFEQKEYEKAAEVFEDPYRKGVACYKAGRFAEAAALFKQNIREEVEHQACYNKGNALACQQKFSEAIVAYEEVLKKWPEDQHAQENLDLIKKMMEQQKQESEQPDQEQNQQKDEQQNQDQPQKQENAESSDSQDQDSNSEKKEEPLSSEAPQNESDTGEDQETNSENETQEDRAIAENEQGQKPEEDLDADVWLNRLSNDPKPFLKNKFYIESKKSGTREGINPW